MVKKTKNFCGKLHCLQKSNASFWSGGFIAFLKTYFSVGKPTVFWCLPCGVKLTHKPYHGIGGKYKKVREVLEPRLNCVLRDKKGHTMSSVKKSDDSVAIEVVVLCQAFTRVKLGTYGLKQLPISLEGKHVYICDANSEAWNHDMKKPEPGGVNILEIQTGCELMNAEFKGGLINNTPVWIDENGKKLGYCSEELSVRYAISVTSIVREIYKDYEQEVNIVFLYLSGEGLVNPDKKDNLKVAKQANAKQALSNSNEIQTV